jgi:hypothetical protein
MVTTPQAVEEVPWVIRMICSNAAAYLPTASSTSHHVLVTSTGFGLITGFTEHL